MWKIINYFFWYEKSVCNEEALITKTNMHNNIHMITIEMPIELIKMLYKYQHIKLSSSEYVLLCSDN